MKKICTIICLLVITLSCTVTAQTKMAEFKPKNSRASILMPGTPAEQVDTVNTAIGLIITHTFMQEMEDENEDDNLVYGIIYLDYPSKMISSDSVSMIKQLFDGSTNGAVSNVEGKKLSETDIKYKTFPGRQVVISIKNDMAIMTMRYYLVKSRMYMLQVICMKEKQNNAAVNKFLDSFKLL